MQNWCSWCKLPYFISLPIPYLYPIFNLLLTLFPTHPYQFQHLIKTWPSLGHCLRGKPSRPGLTHIHAPKKKTNIPSGSCCVIKLSWRTHGRPVINISHRPHAFYQNTSTRKSKSGDASSEHRCIGAALMWLAL